MVSIGARLRLPPLEGHRLVQSHPDRCTLIRIKAKYKMCTNSAVNLVNPAGSQDYRP